MNSFIVTSSIDQLNSTSPYTVLQSISVGSLPFDSTYKSSFSWRKFVRSSTQQSASESVVTVIPTASTTTEGPIVLKPAPLPDDYDAEVEEFFRFLDDLEAGAYATEDITAEQ